MSQSLFGPQQDSFFDNKSAFGAGSFKSGSQFDDGTWRSWQTYLNQSSEVYGPYFRNELESSMNQSIDLGMSLPDLPNHTESGQYLYSVNQSYAQNMSVDPRWDNATPFSSEAQHNWGDTVRTAFDETLTEQMNEPTTQLSWAANAAVCSTAVIAAFIPGGQAVAISTGIWCGHLLRANAVDFGLEVGVNASEGLIDQTNFSPAVKTALKDTVRYGKTAKDLLDIRNLESIAKNPVETIPEVAQAIGTLGDVSADLIDNLVGSTEDIRAEMFRVTDPLTQSHLQAADMMESSKVLLKTIGDAVLQTMDNRQLTPAELDSFAPLFSNEQLTQEWLGYSAVDAAKLSNPTQDYSSLVNRRGTTLVVQGTDGPDEIDLGLDPANPNQVNVRINQTLAATFERGGLSEVRVFAKAGDDRVSLRFDIASYLSGGAGNDVIIGGDGNDEIVAGPGNDQAYGRGGDDVIRGGLGFDELRGSAGKDIIISDEYDFVSDDRTPVSLVSAVKKKPLGAGLNVVPALYNVSVSKTDFPQNGSTILSPDPYDDFGAGLQRYEVYEFDGELLGFDADPSDGFSVEVYGSQFDSVGTKNLISRFAGSNGLGSNWVSKMVDVSEPESEDPTISGLSLLPNTVLQDEFFSAKVVSAENVLEIRGYLDLNQNGISEPSEFVGVADSESNFEFSSISTQGIIPGLYQFIVEADGLNGSVSSQLSQVLNVRQNPDSQPRIIHSEFGSDPDGSNPFILAVFDQEMSQPSVTETAHWLLENDDGISLTINQIAYDSSASVTAKFFVNDGLRLPDHEYEFVAYANSVENLFGAKLLGHSDFTASGITSQDRKIGVRRGEGDRNFRSRSALFTPGRTSRFLQSADINGDGLEDLVGMESVGRMFTMLGNGDGSFQVIQDHSTSSTSLTGFDVGDLTGDGLPELVVTSLDNKVHVFENLGGGAFASPITLSTPDRAKDVVLGDFDLQFGLDIAVTDESGVHIYSNDGTGNMASPSTVYVGDAWYAVSEFIDEDGFRDIAFVSPVSRDVKVLFGQGNNQFVATTAQSGFSSPKHLGFGDFDNDGRKDLVVADENHPDYDLVVLGQVDSRIFSEQQRRSIGRRVNGFDVSDIDRDGLSDVMLAVQKIDSRDNFVFVFNNAGTLSQPAGATTGLLGSPEGNDVAFGEFDDRTRTLEFVIETAVIEDRRVFYNNSFFDGFDSSLNSDDFAAIDPTKNHLDCEETASFENYTNYVHGINGVMLDIQSPGGQLTIDDFEFRVGNEDTVSNWLEASLPIDIEQFAGMGVNQADRVMLAWNDGEIVNSWLQVKILATETTGLASPEVFYFGNAIGETGNSMTDAFVDGTDFAGVRDNPRNFLNPATVSFRFDLNKDRFVDGVDLSIVRDNNTNFLNSLNLITPSCGGSQLRSIQKFGNFYSRWGSPSYFSKTERTPSIDNSATDTNKSRTQENLRPDSNSRLSGAYRDKIAPRNEDVSQHKSISKRFSKLKQKLRGEDALDLSFLGEPVGTEARLL